MNESLFEQIQSDAKYLKLDLRSQEIAQLAMDKSMSQEGILSDDELKETQTANCFSA